MTLSVASLPSELSVLHPGPWPAPASWRRGQPSPSHRGTPCRATAAGSTWSRGGRPGRGDAWQKGWEWRWCWWKAARHRVSLTWTCPRWPPSLLRGSPGWFWCAGGGTQACPAKHTSAASRSTQSVCFGDYYQMDYCFFFFLTCSKGEADSLPALPGHPKSLDTWWRAAASGPAATSDPGWCETERRWLHLVTEWELGGRAEGNTWRRVRRKCQRSAWILQTDDVETWMRNVRHQYLVGLCSFMSNTGKEYNTVFSSIKAIVQAELSK